MNSWMNCVVFLIDISGSVENVLEQRELPAQLIIQKTTTPPPPPLTPAGQPVMNRGEILMDVTNMPPMQQYNAEYVHDVNGTTYLQM